MSSHPWFPQDSTESLCSWQPGVSKVTPAGRIRTTDLPDWVKLAAQWKASCNICKQSQTPLNFFSPVLGSVLSLALCPSLPSRTDLGQEYLRTVVQHGCPHIPTHVRAAQGRGHGKEYPFFGVWPCSTVCSHGSQQVILAQPAAEGQPTQGLGAIRKFVRI